MLNASGTVPTFADAQNVDIWNERDFRFHVLVAVLLVSVALGFCLKVPMLIYLKSSQVSWIN